ncbi:excalibur calcium-binding domain-containing protein [Schinkia sp. CFF1]
MKKLVIGLLSIGLLTGASTTGIVHAQAKFYKNCKELNKVYPGGVAISATVKNKGGKTKSKPTVSNELYQANKGKDRDNDGIACER